MCCAYSSGGSRALRQHSSILRTLRIEVSFLQSDRGSIRTPLLRLAARNGGRRQHEVERQQEARVETHGGEGR